MSEVANRVLERCGSTNDLARELGERGAPHGTWVSARTQEHGRGRLGREWRSLEGNLFLSLVARIEDKKCWTWVPLATAVGLARALLRRFPALPLRIKWPNDLWLVPEGAPAGASGSKLGGILCEAVGNRGGSFIVIGLGINCVHAPERLDQPTASLTQGAGRLVDADEIRAEAIRGVLDALGELVAVGPEGILRDYERLAAFPPGTAIEWVAGRGVVKGLGASGELLVVGERGVELKLFAEDVRVRSTAPKASGGSPA